MRLMFSIIIVLGIAGIGLSSGVFSNSHSKTSNFVIFAERTDEGVELTCKRGCAWKTLGWTCSESEACRWGIDPMGMFSPSSGSASEDFQIIFETGTDTGELTCRKGCAWKTLTWSCGSDPCEARIDFNGITTRP